MTLLRLAALLLAVAPAGQTASGSLGGVVVELGTNRPLPKVTLELRSTVNPAIRYPAVSSNEGQFTFRNLPPGNYALSAALSGYINADANATLVVSPETRRADMRIAMIRSGAISGRAYDREGEPAASAQVHALRVSYMEGRRVLLPATSQVTDDRGEYRLFGLAPGQYYVSVQPEPRNYVRSPAYESLGPPLPGASIVSISAGTAGGTVDPANARSQGADWSPTYYGGTIEEANATPISLDAGGDVRGIDVVVDRIPMWALRGIVVGPAGEPVRAARVVVTPIVPNAASAAMVTVNVTGGKLSIAASPQIQTSATGEFRTPLMARGGYLMTAIVDEQGRRLSGKTAVELRAPTPADVPIPIVLAPGSDVPGRVLFEGRPADAANPDLAALSVGLISVASSIGDIPPVAPGPAGAFTLRNAVAGDYLLSVLPLSHPLIPENSGAVPAGLRNAYVQSARIGSRDILKDGFRFSGVADGPIEIVIGASAGAVAGVVVDGNQSARSNITVVLLPEETQRGRIDLYRSAASDASGRFRLERVPPGRYKLFAWEYVEKGAWHNPLFMSLHEQRGQALTVGEGKEETVELAVIPFR